jgi:preprotein translocase subunit SecA
MHVEVNAGQPPPPMEQRELPPMEGHHIDPLTGQDEMAAAPLLADDGSVRSREAAAAINPNDPRTWGRVSRNAACPCGSGKKFKHCHGALV